MSKPSPRETAWLDRRGSGIRTPICLPGLLVPAVLSLFHHTRIVRGSVLLSVSGILLGRSVIVCPSCQSLLENESLRAPRAFPHLHLLTTLSCVPFVTFILFFPVWESMLSSSRNRGPTAEDHQDPDPNQGESGRSVVESWHVVSWDSARWLDFLFF